MSKECAWRIKILYLNLILSHQNAYIINKFIKGHTCKGYFQRGRLIFDILESAVTWKMKGCLLKIDTENTFDTVHE